MGVFAMQTHEFVKELVDAGFTEKQADAIARNQAKIIDENLATKQDLVMLGEDLEIMRKDMLIKLGMMFVTGWGAAIGIILSVLR